MGIYRDIAKLPEFKNSVITIGTFDGVHQGHKVILNEVVKHARNEGGESVVVTFEPHPRKLLAPHLPIKLLTPLEQKLELIINAGIEHVVVAPFTRDFSNLSAHDYIEHFLVNCFHPKSIVIGYDHHFGHDRTGNIKLLQDMAAEFGYTVYEIPAQMIDDAAVSSTKIRHALNSGQVAEAAHMLGRNYSIVGTVYHGAKRGRTIGYPTANIQPIDPDQQIPAIGVYAVLVKWNGQTLKGMMSIGYNPTVTDEKILRIEVNILDFDGDLYGEKLEVEFVARLRGEEKFESLEALKAQLHKDKDDTMRVLQN